MLKRSFALLISLLLFAGTIASPSVWAQPGSELEAARVRAKAEQFGVGSNVEVKLRDKTKVKGRIDQTEQHSFSVADREGTIRTIGYTEVADVKKAGGVSTKTWIILGSVVAGALVTWAIVKPALCDGGAQSRGPC